MINNIRSSSLLRNGERRTKPIRHFFRKFFNDWSMDFSAMIAYNTLIALLPIVVALFGTLGVVLRNYPVLRDEIKNKTIDFFPSDNTTQAGIRQLVDLAFNQLSNNANLILVIGIILALFGASRLFIAIDKCMTIIYRLPERTFLKQNLLAIGMIFLFIIIIPLIIAASSAPTALLSIIPGGGGSVGIFIGGFIFSLIAGFLFFEIIYWVMPNKKMTFKVTWCGALVAAGTLEIFILLFPLYIRYFMDNYAGQIGFAVILVLFFFYFATILVLGAQINAFFFGKYKPLSDGLGTYINHVYEEYGVEETNRPLYENESDIQQQQSSTMTMATNTSQSPQRNNWSKKLWPSKINSTNNQDEERENIT